MSIALALASTLVFVRGMGVQRGNVRTAATSHPGITATSPSVDHPLAALMGLAPVVTLTIRRVATHQRESFRDFLHKAWDPRPALMIVAVLFGVVVQIYVAWNYTDLLGD